MGAARIAAGDREPGLREQLQMLEERAEETATLKAAVSTLRGRIEALERAMQRVIERDLKMRRAVGQMASAYDVTEKR